MSFLLINIFDFWLFLDMIFPFYELNVNAEDVHWRDWCRLQMKIKNLISISGFFGIPISNWNKVLFFALFQNFFFVSFFFYCLPDDWRPFDIPNFDIEFSFFVKIPAQLIFLVRRSKREWGIVEHNGHFHIMKSIWNFFFSFAVKNSH